MSYLGQEPEFASYPSKLFSGDGSTTDFTLDHAPPNDAALLVFIDGVRQDTNAFSLSGTTLQMSAAPPSGTDNVEVVHLGLKVDVGTPGDSTVTSAKIADGAIVNADINASAAIALSKLASDPSNASNLTSGTVATARLGAGTASSSTFLRGDQTYAAAMTPAFMGRGSGGSISSGTWVKADFGEETFDTDSTFDYTTNDRWTPGVAGTYFVSAHAHINALANAQLERAKVAIYKNGSLYLDSQQNLDFRGGGDNREMTVMVSNAVVLGATDYVEMYVWGTDTSGSPNAGAFMMTGFRIMGA